MSTSGTFGDYINLRSDLFITENVFFVFSSMYKSAEIR